MDRLVGAAVIYGFCIGGALANEPAALVLETSGQITPEVAPYDEIDEGVSIDLGTSAAIRLIHYGACEEIGFIGGRIRIGHQAVESDGSKIGSRTPVTCPDTVAVQAAELVNMTTILRSFRPIKVIPGRPEFILSGSWPDQFDRIEVHARDGMVTTVAIEGGRATWSGDATSLLPGETYAVVLKGPAARQHAAHFMVSGDLEGKVLLKRE